MRSTDEYRALLHGVADRLVEGKNTPISVRELCGILDVKIRRSPAQKSAILVNVDSAAEILLPPSGRTRHVSTVQGPFEPRTSPMGRLRYEDEARERFWVAHEIGHWVLRKSKVPAPFGKSEYWIHEELCDDFASRLLVPRSAIQRLEEHLSNPIPDSSNNISNPANTALSALESLVESTWVPWELAAYRVHRWNTRFWFFTVRRCEAKRFRVVFTALHNRREIRRVITAETSLGMILSRATIGVTKDLSPADLAPLASASSAASAALKRLSPSEIRLAVYGDTSCHYVQNPKCTQPESRI